MRLVIMSDTHTYHGPLSVPDGDVVIHCGDFTRQGSMADVQSFLSWFDELPHKRKIFIAGNHDWAFEVESAAARAAVPDGVTYLQDSGVEIDGIKFWGSPWTPRFLDWAFNGDRGESLATRWAMIPEDTQVLITHGPPFGVGDTVRDWDRRSKFISVGCQDLARRIEDLPLLKLHAFGHIHEGAGVYGKSVNASVLDGRYKFRNPPVLFDL